MRLQDLYPGDPREITTWLLWVWWNPGRWKGNEKTALLANTSVFKKRRKWVQKGKKGKILEAIKKIITKNFPQIQRKENNVKKAS